jgi:hypothetical protein
MIFGKKHHLWRLVKRKYHIKWLNRQQTPLMEVGREISAQHYFRSDEEPAAGTERVAQLMLRLICRFSTEI